MLLETHSYLYYVIFLFITTYPCHERNRGVSDSILEKVTYSRYIDRI